MLCNACGQQAPPRSAFCNRCGARLATPGGGDSTGPVSPVRSAAGEPGNATESFIQNDRPNAKVAVGNGDRVWRAFFIHLGPPIAKLLALPLTVVVFYYLIFPSDSTPPQVQTSASGAPSQGEEPATPEPLPAPSGNRWQVDEKSNPIDGSSEVRISLEADNTIHVFLGSFRPELIVDCRKGKTHVYVNVGKPVHSDVETGYSAVRVRIDDGSPEQQSWSESTNFEALFSREPVQLARKLAKSHKLLFEFTPNMEVEETVEFTLDGLSDVLPQVSRACRWHL